MTNSKPQSHSWEINRSVDGEEGHAFYGHKIHNCVYNIWSLDCVMNQPTYCPHKKIMKHINHVERERVRVAEEDERTVKMSPLVPVAVFRI